MARRVVGAIVPPRELGELLSAAEIADRHFKGRPSRRWVAERMPRDRAVKVGRELHWYEADVLDVMAQMRGAA